MHAFTDEANGAKKVKSDAVKQWTTQRGMILTLAVLACGNAVAQASRGLSVYATSSLSGVIRDAEGVPQMGALVEAFLPETGLAASALTDARGRYRLLLRPGSYRLRASAALLAPAVRDHLLLSDGTRNVVNLTLAAVLAPSGWIPAVRRSTTEPGDDWMWTLRSTANRSILRYADTAAAGSSSTGDGDAGLEVSSSGEQSRRGATGGSLSMRSSDGGFARGGTHQVMVLTRVDDHGTSSVLRADLSGPRAPYPVSPSSEVSVGMQRRGPLGGSMRTVLTYSSHPELTTGNGRIGLHGATLRSAERVELGDAMQVDAGSVLRDANLGGNTFAMEPFLHVSFHVPGVVLAYGFTRSRGTETMEDLDRVQAAVPTAVTKGGRLLLESGSHHALSASAQMKGGGAVEVTLYQDNLQHPLISGMGTMAAADLPSEGIVADPTTGTYRVLARSYAADGLRVSVRQPLTPALAIGAEASTGRALRSSGMGNSDRDANLATLIRSLRAERAYAGLLYLDGRIVRTGTVVRASYRWQPEGTLTTVDAYHAADESGFLSCSVRQSLGRIPGLPQELEAVVDLQNVLSEGYQPYRAADGGRLDLAQTPRAIQGGLLFTF